MEPTMRELIQRLLEQDISSYQINKEAGVASSIVLNLRNGKRDIDNISLLTAEKLAAYQLKLEQSEEN